MVFEGRSVSALGLDQPLALAPGRYHLIGKVANYTTASRPFALEVVCTTSGRLAGSVELPAARSGRRWQSFSGAVEVSGDACTDHVLRLRYLGRSLNERILSGTLRLDALDLRPQ